MTKNWLDKYNDGGPVQENYNDASASMGPGFVGLGYDTTGRNYSPAWGGQFQDGGFLQPTSSKLPEGYVIPYNTPSTELAMSIGGEKGEPAYLIPSFKGGKKLKDPIAEFKKTGEHLGGPFKTWQEAEKFGEMRHQYVEKGQDIPTPLKTWGDMAMGGNIPGSVGFTYARTNSPAPSNGKYAKKTKASAQNGKEMKFYQEGLDWKPKNISQDGRSISKELKKEAEEKLKRMGKSKATISQYTPKKGEAERLDKEKLQRIEESYQPLNRLASSKGAKNLQDAALFAADVMGAVEGVGAVKGLLKKAPKFNLSKAATTVEEDAAVRAASNTLSNPIITRGPINWWEEPKFMKRNPGYNPNLPPPNPFPGYTTSDVPKEMMPYLTPNNPDPSIYQRKYAEGGIVDPRGQWAHPGKITTIPGTDITMKGVDYPVLGISDTGDTKMMKPGKDYKFKGTKVTEYPQGGWLNKYK